MNLDFSMAQVAPPPLPEAVKTRSREEDDYLADRQEDAKIAEFNRVMQEELARKRHVVPPNLPPMQWIPQAPVENTEKAIDLVTGSEGATTTSPDTRWFAPPPPTPIAARPDPRTEVRTAVPEPAPREEEAPQAIAPIKIMVEPGLPIVQPNENQHGPNVPLSRFPQLVSGHIRNAVRDGQPLTQLDFHISPPYVGPVQLSISLNQHVVSVQLTALSLQAKQALEGQVGAIHSILTAHNLTPGQIRIVTAAGGKNGANGAGQKDQPGFNFFGGGRRKPQGADDNVTVT